MPLHITNANEVPLSNLPGEHLRILGFALANALHHVGSSNLRLAASDLSRVD